MTYRPDPRILTLGPAFYDPVEPASFSRLQAAFPQSPLCRARRTGARPRRAMAATFCRFEPLPNNLTRPLALRYHGHQFRVYNPDIGDSRGSLSRSFETTPIASSISAPRVPARRLTAAMPTADLTLKGEVREVLATEMLEALGVNTSKSFALFETGEALERGDGPRRVTSGLTRLSHGRSASARSSGSPSLARSRTSIGSSAIASKISLPTASSDRTKRPRLFDLVSAATAKLAASYLAAGFVHGVLNSDNINITGESFDYGPWRFTPYWDTDSRPLISTITVFMPLRGSLSRSNGTSRDWADACLWSRRRTRCRNCSRAGPIALKMT